MVGKFFCCSASLASGIALGREGPSVQVGAGIASVVARNLGLDAQQVKALVPVGCAAALAAAFNTPIAAVLFSLEEIMGDLHASVLGSVVLSSATSWMVLHLVLGDDPLFHVSGLSAGPSRGIRRLRRARSRRRTGIGGVRQAAAGAARVVLRRCPNATVWFQPVAGGLTVGLMGFFVPEVHGRRLQQRGQGSERRRGAEAGGVVRGAQDRRHAVCYASGNAGGIFGPALFIGAMMGAAVGSVAHTLFPHTPPARAPTRWSAWERHSPESCARR